MSISILTIIGCDDCGETYAGGDMKSHTATQQRSDYASDGWKHIGLNDYCPECLESKNGVKS